MRMQRALGTVTTHDFQCLNTAVLIGPQITRRGIDGLAAFGQKRHTRGGAKFALAGGACTEGTYSSSAILTMM